VTYEDDEPQRVLGLPVRRGGPRQPAYREPRSVLGMPLSWFGPRPHLDTRWARHPVRWLRWRSQVHRLGPYAPDYEEGNGPKGTGA